MNQIAMSVFFNKVEEAPADALFALVARHKADTFEKKVDLSVGAYRDNDGKPWILPVVKRVDGMINADPTLNHEYLPIAGLADFTTAGASLIFGKNHGLTVSSVQTISGTGANHLAAVFLKKFHPSKNIYLPDPTWANHKGIFNHAGLNVKSYPYYDKKTSGLDYDGLIKTLSTETAPGDIVLLHACAHNPTGVDPTPEQWRGIAKVVQEKQLFPLFDSAYQGFASGDLDADAYAVRYFAGLGIELAVCQSFSKNFGLYGQRAGNLHVVVKSENERKAVQSQLAAIERAEISNPPAYGARIVARTLNNPDLFDEWVRDLRTMANRIIEMRKALRSKLEELNTPGTWNHITDQIGMFSFTGLTPQQSERMVEEFHVYMTKNGRISMAGLNNKNVEYVAQCINTVVKG